VDVLVDLLERSRARGALFAHSTVRGPFGLAFTAGRGLAIHAIAGGELWLVGAGEPVHALVGDVLLVRGDRAHGLARPAGHPTRPLAEFIAEAAVPGAPRRFAAGEGPAPATSFLCGAYRFEGDLCASLLEALPPVIHVRPAAGSALRAAVDLLAREMEADVPGQQTVLDRLLDVCLVCVLREHFAASPEARPRWYAAQADPQVGGALRALHAEPGRAWTVAGLAAEVGLSRAAFARRFAALVGRPPLEYLTGWRMALAREALRDTDAPLAAIARDVGYANEFAFAAAFKREHGSAPGRWRAERRALDAGQAA
jgi:AraC-like DNA-binding protein